MHSKKESDWKSKILTSLAVLLFLGTISVFASNIIVSESGIQPENYYSNDGSVGLTQNISYMDGYGETQVLVVKNGIIVDAEGIDAAFPSEGLTAYYKLDDTTGSVIDQLGDNPGTNNGATRGAIGKINNSFNFDGINDYVSLGTETFSSNSNGTISFETIKNFVETS